MYCVINLFNFYEIKNNFKIIYYNLPLMTFAIISSLCRTKYSKKLWENPESGSTQKIGEFYSAQYTVPARHCDSYSSDCFV